MALAVGCSPDASPRAVPPTTTYAEAAATIARRQTSDDSVALRADRSILLSSGTRTQRAFVLLHGLTDSPVQFAPLATRLSADGNNVFVPRFPRHGLPGSNAGALASLTASELRAFADSVVSSAAGLGDSTIV